MIIRWMLAAILTVAAGYAQDPPPARGRAPFEPPSEFGRGGAGARFLGAEAGRPGRVVKNAPYSADVVTESVQTLADGNRIRQTGSARVYRDSEGRTRREQTLHSLGGLAPNANLPPVVFINDPVAGANYALNAHDKTATRSVWTAAGRGSERYARPDGQNRPGGNPPGGLGRFAEARARGNVKTESLGHQTVEGVQADGTRTTVTIPAGQMGNEQPLQIVSETWYSPDLQAVVLAKRTDPRMGETVTRLTNITRVEPARALFEVPSDFKVTDGPRGAGRMPPGANR